jgi:hypothetical protein
MGWDFCKTPNIEKRIREGYPLPNKCVDVEFDGNTGFVSLELADGRIVAEIVLIDGREGGDVGLKFMPENHGPYATGASEAFLDKLSPTKNEWALVWRQRCRERNNRKVVA